MLLLEGACDASSSSFSLMTELNQAVVSALKCLGSVTLFLFNGSYCRFVVAKLACCSASLSLEGRPRTSKEIRELAKKRTARRAWTKEDVRTLKSIAKAKAGVTRISKSVKRTPAATTVKAVTLGVSLSMR
jgi:hypothetical protein